MTRHAERPSLPPDSRSDQYPRPRAARDGAADDRSSQRRSSRRSGGRCSTACKRIFQTSAPVVIFPASGTGAWEAALVNTLSPGDQVLAFDIGEFAGGWAEVARRLGLDVEVTPETGGTASIRRRSRRDSARIASIASSAVLVVHNETSTGVTSRLPEIRRAIDRAGHPALLFVDAVSSLGVHRSPPRRVGDRRDAVADRRRG